jgi:hypothetical protein
MPGEIAKPSRQRLLPSDAPGMPFVGLEHIESHSMRLLQKAAAGDVRSSSLKFFKGDVLYSRMRPYLNKTGVEQRSGAQDGLPRRWNRGTGWLGGVNGPRYRIRIDEIGITLEPNGRSQSALASAIRARNYGQCGTRHPGMPEARG